MGRGHQTSNGHRDSMIELAQWADSMKNIYFFLIIHVAPHINGFSLGEKRKAYPKATPIGPILVQAWKAGKAKSLNNKNLNLFWGVCIASLWAVYTHQ